MTLLVYQIFQTVVEQGSFQHAAEILNLTPSAISHAISTAEKELGFPLFNRNKNGVTLTSYGENLQPYILTVLNSDAKLQQAILEFNGLTHGSVKIGTFSSVCNNFIPDLVTSFSKSHPSIEIKIYQGTYDDVAYWIKNGIVDFGFLSVSSAGDIPIEPLYKDPLLCIVPKGTKISEDGKWVTVEDLRDCQFVTQRESTDADIQKFLKENNLNVESHYHVVDDLSTIAMVANGFGICLMPEMVMNDIPYEVDSYPLAEEAFRIIGLAALSREYMAPAARSLYQYAKEQYCDSNK